MSERVLQVAVIKAVSKILPDFPALALLHHIPNGELRDGKTALRLRRMGVLKGIPDLNLPVARKGYTGLWMELKIPSGVIAPYQVAVQGMLRKEGHKVLTIRSVDEAIEALKEYLS